MPFNWPLAATANKRSRQRTYHTFFDNPCMKGQELAMACFAKEFFYQFCELNWGRGWGVTEVAFALLSQLSHIISIKASLLEI